MNRLYLLGALAMVLIACQPKVENPTTNVSVQDSSVDSTATEKTKEVKIGYVNSAELLNMLPEIQAANKSIESYARRKERQFNNLVKAYQDKLGEAQQKGPTLTPAEQESYMKELQGMQERIQNMQANSQGDIEQERQKLYAPILERTDSIIKKIGEEEGFTFIYDAPGLLYADTTLNLLPKVKSRLGIDEMVEEEK